MAPTDPSVAALSAEQAINAILEAEEHSRERLERCRAEAARIVSDARVTARRIHERTDARIVTVHELGQRGAAARTAELEAAAGAVRSRPVQGDARAEELARAVAELAAELSGGAG